MQPLTTTTDLNAIPAAPVVPALSLHEQIAVEAVRREDLKCLAGMRLAEIERLALLHTLCACDFRRSGAARMLGVSEKTIYNKLRQYGLLST